MIEKQDFQIGEDNNWKNNKIIFPITHLFSLIAIFHITHSITQRENECFYRKSFYSTSESTSHLYKLFKFFTLDYGKLHNSLYFVPLYLEDIVRFII